MDSDWDPTVYTSWNQRCPLWNSGVSSLKFCPTANIMAVADWDNTITCYKYNTNNDELDEIGQRRHTRAALCCCWDKSGNNIFSGGCDNTINIWNIGRPSTKNSFTKLGSHKSTINCLEYAKNYNLLISGSWDKSIKYWDIRCNHTKTHNQTSTNNKNKIKNESCVGGTKLDNKVYAMSQKGNTLILGLSNNCIRYCDLRMIGGYTTYELKTNKNKNQIRDIDLFPDEKAFTVSLIGGRCFVFDLNESEITKDFSFKCHRETKNCLEIGVGYEEHCNVYSVNVVRYLPRDDYGTFVTGGDDGEINIWNKEDRARIATYDAWKDIKSKRPVPITAIGFDRTGKIMAGGLSYNSKDKWCTERVLLYDLMN